MTSGRKSPIASDAVTPNLVASSAMLLRSGTRMHAAVRCWECVGSVGLPLYVRTVAGGLGACAMGTPSGEPWGIIRKAVRLRHRNGDGFAPGSTQRNCPPEPKVAGSSPVCSCPTPHRPRARSGRPQHPVGRRRVGCRHRWLEGPREPGRLLGGRPSAQAAPRGSEDAMTRCLDRHQVNAPGCQARLVVAPL